MKNHSSILASIIICLGLVPAISKPGSPGGAPSGPPLGGTMSKLFGDNQAFSAGLEMHIADKSGKPITMSGKISYDAGMQRFEVNLADMKGGNLPPNAAAQMKAMGMDQAVTVARPDKKVAYLMYPGMQSYVEIQLSKADSAPTNSDYKVEITEIGKETVDGHPCVKNKVVVTGKDGVAHVSTVWNATDLKNFPVKIQTTDQGREMTMIYKDISFAKPDASLFEPPAGYMKFDSIQEMMRATLMKQAVSGPGGPVTLPPQK